jgi:hypothetical protein
MTPLPTGRNRTPPTGYTAFALDKIQTYRRVTRFHWTVKTSAGNTTCAGGRVSRGRCGPSTVPVSIIGFPSAGSIRTTDSTTPTPPFRPCNIILAAPA